MSPRQRRWPRVAAFLALLALGGCGGQSLQRIARDEPRLPPAVELEATPFHPQEEYQCGPAALATALGASGVEVAPDALVSKVYVPRLKGSLQAEMISATRAFDRLAYRVGPAAPSDARAALSSLMGTLAEGFPVLVLLNLGVDSVPIWHYAVVIGYDSKRNELLLRSGTQRRALMSLWRFEGAWDRAQNWGIAVVKPDQLPASANAERYLEGAAGLESAGRLATAQTAYAAAAARWPQNATARLGLGNVYYRRQRLPEAEAAFRAALELDPGHAVARNNLAQALLEQGRAEEALAEIQTAQGSLSDPRFAAALAATESAIRAVLRDRVTQP